MSTGSGATTAQATEVGQASEAGPFYADPTFWVGAGFVIFLAILFYLKVHKSAATALDARGAKIKSDLDDAAKLRRDAETLLADAQARFAGADAEAGRIVDQATRNAREIAEQGGRDLEALIARRSKAAAERIAATERAADAMLRARTVDMATERARTLLATQADAAVQARLVDGAIAAL